MISFFELEGIINSLLAQSIIFKRDVDLDLAERIVRKAVRYCELWNNRPELLPFIAAKGFRVRIQCFIVHKQGVLG